MIDSYNNLVAKLRRAELNKRALDFVKDYDPALPSVVLLPGGMGSRLLQSEATFQPSQPFPRNTDYLELWLRLLRVIDGDMKDLTMTSSDQDKTLKPIIASGELSSLVKKYEGVEEFFRGKANYIGFGYDWRRSPDKEFMYLRAFLKLIQSKVKRKGHPDPLPNLTLYAHSQGGLIAKLFISDLIVRGEDSREWFNRCITCATPFYGTFTHLSRFYDGITIMNLFTGGTKKVCKIVASLKGPYILLIAPESILKPRYDALGLKRYPVRDKINKGTKVDVFSSLGSVKKRLPEYFMHDYLSLAKNIYMQLDAELTTSAKEQVFHIRSNINKDGNRPLELFWKNINGTTFKGDPMSDNGKGKGMHDGTVPFWSARMATTPDSHVFNFTGIEHGGVAEHPDVLKLVWKLAQGQNPGGGDKACGPDFTYGSTNKLVSLIENNPQNDRLENILNNLPEDVHRTLLKNLTLA